MSNKPDLVPQSQVIEQVKGLLEQKHKLEVQKEQLVYRLKLIQASLEENHVIGERVQGLTAESLTLFQEELKRRADFFPDIWLAVLERAVVVAQPPKKK